MHQCRRCGMVYDCCNGAKCGQPFENGHCQICLSPAAMAMDSNGSNNDLVATMAN
jgi:hypothetical protein